MSSKPTSEVRPDKFTDRVGWNRSWEHDLGIVSNFNNPLPELWLLCQRVSKAVAFKQLPLVAGQNQDSLHLQNEIQMYALPHLATNGLEERWRNLEHKEREEIILEVLYRTCCIDDMENKRRWCPDMTINNIAASNGEFFMKVLKAIVTKPLKTGKPEPIFFPHPCSELITDNPALGSMEALVQSHRCAFISMFVWRMLLLLCNDEQSFVPVDPPKLPGWKSVLSQIEQVYGQDEKQRAKQNAKEYRRMVKDYANFCMYCLKGTSQLAPGSQLMNCAACKKADRITRYCSKECQTMDWKSGRHKEICGKPFFVTEEAPPQDVNGKIPVSDPGFIKSPALLYQITLLEQPTNLDYVYMLSGESDNIGIILPVPVTRIPFLIMRQRALRSGDKGAVKFMFQLLSTTMANSIPQFSKHDLKRQFEKEYGVDVDNVDEDLEPPTEEEMEWARNLISAFG